jgi:hypothetical protein
MATSTRPAIDLDTVYTNLFIIYVYRRILIGKSVNEHYNKGETVKTDDHKQLDVKMT